MPSMQKHHCHDANSEPAQEDIEAFQGRDFDVDKQLQEIAEEVTQYGLNFCGGTFVHGSTGEEFTITIAKNSSVKAMKEDAEQLNQELGKVRSYADKFEQALHALYESGCLDSAGIALYRKTMNLD